MIIKPTRLSSIINRGNPFSRELAIALPFNELTGNVLYDRVINHPFTMDANAPRWVYSNHDTGLNFDTGVEYLSSPHHNSLNVGTGGITVTARIRTSAVSNQYIVNKNYGGTGIKWWALTSTDTAYFLMDDGTTAQNVTTNTSIADSEWHIISGVRDNNGNLYIFLDGYDDTNGSGSQANDCDNTGELWIGAQVGGSATRDYFGDISFVSVHTRYLTPIEIYNYHNDLYRIFRHSKVLPWLYTAGGDITGTHTAFSIAVTKGFHTGAVDILGTHTAESLAVTKGSHTGVTDIIGIHTAESIALTKGTHTGVVGSQGIHSAESLAVTKGFHTGVIDIIGIHISYSPEITKGTHAGVVGGNIIGIHTAFSIAVTKGIHSGPVDITGEHTSFSIGITKGSHTGFVAINGVHTAKLIDVTNGTHIGVIDILGIHTAFSLALTLGIHTGTVSSTVGYFNKSKTHVGIDTGV